MLVFRIVLAKYSSRLIASGRAARWNSNDVEMIYTASSRSLACLENVVHRDEVGLSQLFNIMTIECPAHLEIKTIDLNELSPDWADFGEMHLTQAIGNNWIKEGSSPILQVPSSIVSEDVNYLLNPKHKDFELIRLAKVQSFVFDGRIKQAPPNPPRKGGL